ncbi:tail fiber protein [Escherichia marmotae]|uniref:tail fiber protein n=4 Tax=Escherichia coli TaxID=562 RepID=UPI0009079B01|nr:tail fiber protein [Escherichia coli]MEC9904237.1 tail fiber protein [Escherichia marmotae]EER8704987.1 phage tail protein [Escherichia coli]EFF8510442.1 phage tail protein [Escherichia coli]EFG0754731.1 phage tail protein [Escherichia coli]EFI3280253.1 phage tail protein [Escherichia coli]
MTDAGRQELVNANKTGTNKVEIVSVGLGSRYYVTSTSQTNITNEIKRLTTIGGKVVSPDTIHVTAKDDSKDEYVVHTIGLYTNKGTLFAVYSQEQAIINKASSTIALISSDIAIKTLDTKNITFGDIEFINPPATETVVGVARFANEQEIDDGTDDSLAVSAKRLKQAIVKHEQSRNHPDATLTSKGFVQLSSATNSSSETLAATPKAVKAAYDLANGKYTAQDATTARKGIVQLSSATNSTSETLAATPKAVKAAYDLAAGKAPSNHTHSWEQITNVPVASLTVRGITQLSSSTNSTSETLAATSKAVKAVMDETNKKAPLNSPALTGTPTTPTARQGTNNTQIASTAFVMAAIAALVDSSPDALNTLNELAAALGNDPNFATTMTNALAGKQPKDATLTALAGLATAADKFPYFTGNDVASLATLTKVGRDILAKSTVAAVIEYLGLQETVNKAGNAVQKTGDTLSGGLTFENDSILAWIRNTDWAKIGFKNDADSDTDSYMWFETGDNGNEYFKWRSKQSTTTKDLMNLKWDALSVLVKALFSSEVKISTVNALRIFNSSFGAIFRRSEECLHIIPTRENEGENGDIGPLRPFTLNLRTGRISMGHGLDVTGDIFANRFAINSSTGMWIHMRDQNVILGRNAVSTDGAQALLRQDHADRKFMIGGLGNKQFGIYMINNSRTANGTDGQAYMDNNGNWLCGSQVIPGNYGNFDSRYVKDVRLGSQQYYGVNNWQTWNFQCPSGHVLSGINVQDTGSNSADNIAGVYYRPVQKYINGTWYNVASV